MKPFKRLTNLKFYPIPVQKDRFAPQKFTMAFTDNDWVEAKLKFEAIFGGGIEMDGLLFLIGIQELGQGFREFEKDEKMNLMHIAVCRLLQPYGHYAFSHKDDDGWPHYTKSSLSTGLSQKDQENLLKEAVINYSETQL